MKTKTGQMILQKTTKKSKQESVIQSGSFKDIIRKSFSSSSHEKQPKTPKSIIKIPVVKRSSEESIKEIKDNRADFSGAKPKKISFDKQVLQLSRQLNLHIKSETIGEKAAATKNCDGIDEGLKTGTCRKSASQIELIQNRNKQLEQGLRQIQSEKKQLEVQNYRLIEFNFHLHTAFKKLLSRTKDSVLVTINRIEHFEYSEAVRKLYETIENLKVVQQAVEKISQRLETTNHIEKLKQAERQYTQLLQSKKVLLRLERLVYQQKIYQSPQMCNDPIYFESEHQIGRSPIDLGPENMRSFHSEVNEYRHAFQSSTHKNGNFHHESIVPFGVGVDSFDEAENYRGSVAQNNRHNYESEKLILENRNSDKVFPAKTRDIGSSFTSNKQLFQSDVKPVLHRFENRRDSEDKQSRHSRQSRKSHSSNFFNGMAKPLLINPKGTVHSSEVYRMLIVQAATLEELLV